MIDEEEGKDETVVVVDVLTVDTDITVADEFEAVVDETKEAEPCAFTVVVENEARLDEDVETYVVLGLKFSSRQLVG